MRKPTKSMIICVFFSLTSCKSKTETLNSEAASGGKPSKSLCIVSNQQSKAALELMDKIGNMTVGEIDNDGEVVRLLKIELQTNSEPMPCTQKQIEDFVSANTSDSDTASQILNFPGESMALSQSSFTDRMGNVGMGCVLVVAIGVKTMGNMICQREGFAKAFDRAISGIGGK